MPIIQVEAPQVDDKDMLRGYLNRLVLNLNIALSKFNYHPPRSILPERLKPGEVYYFSAAIATTDITGEGLWLYKSTGWVQLG